ncbi:retrovirus-related pol polyprotein from transposon TNT 1-94 [Tanacetum coccineum]|uniref:Retrovirus-related pol polyprotein from transposon TNT 1-94 n=1 Tax=Tanacetum coccineum TaxID=301880 RepID=A0ABQ4YXS5_9ASTR
MSETVPPIPSPLGTNTGSHVTNVPAFDVEDFSSWKDRFLVYLDGLKPYHLIEILENGPFVPMSPLSTSTNQLTKPQKQWSPEDRKLANQDKRLKSIIISCLPNDIMKSVIKCTTAKAMWTDLVLAHEGPYDTKDTKIAALRLKFNAFKALESEKVNGTFTRLKCLLNDLENNGVSKCHDSDSDVEEDTRSSSEFLADLNAEFHDRALLANQKRYYKRSRRVRSAKKPIDKTKETCFACGKLGHFQKDCPSTKTSTPSYPSSNKTYSKPKFQSNSTPQHNQSVKNHQKDYKGKYKGLKAEIAIHTKKIDSLSKGKSEKGLVAKSFDWDEKSVSSEDEGVTKVKSFVAIVEE